MNQEQLTHYPIKIMGGKEYYVPCLQENEVFLKSYETMINNGEEYDAVNNHFAIASPQSFIDITLPAIQKVVEGYNLLENQKEYRDKYNDFWKEIIEDENGNINKEQLAKELNDYSDMIDRMTTIVCHVTGNTLSYPTYPAETVIRLADEYLEDQLEEMQKQAHPEYDFEEGNRVTYEEGHDTVFAVLTYNDDMGAWLLLNYTDETYTDIKTDEEGGAVCDLVFEIGWDVLELFDEDDWSDGEDE